MQKHLIVIGAGPAGYVAALQAGAAGLRVSLIGGHDLGGTCLQRGCIPTKTLIASCEVLDKCRDASKFGLELQGTIAPDWPALRRRMESVVGTMTGGIDGLLEQRGITRIPGRARLLDTRRVALEDGSPLHGDAILICTGSVPAVPAAFPVDGQRVVTSDEALRWTSLPASLVIIGGGVIACEFAFIFQTLGVAVSVIEAEDRPLAGEDTAISTVIQREMRKRRIRFLPKALVEQMEVDDAGVRCYQNGQLLASAERALIAIGRRANTAGLDLDAAGLKPGRRGEIPVDRHLQTCVPGIYAAGDVNGRLMLAHAASAQAQLAVRHLLGERTDPIQDENVARVTFTRPEVASVGLSEQQALERGLEIRCGSFDFRALGKAHAGGELAGLVKVVAQADTGRLLGVHMVGAHCAEMIHEAAVIVNAQGSVEDICRTVHAHPTLSEGIYEAAESIFGVAPHKPDVRPSTQDTVHASYRRLSV